MLRGLAQFEKLEESVALAQLEAASDLELAPELVPGPGPELGPAHSTDNPSIRNNSLEEEVERRRRRRDKKSAPSKQINKTVELRGIILLYNRVEYQPSVR